MSTEAGAIRKPRRRWPWILAAILLVIGLFIAFFNWNWLRGPIDGIVSAKLHRHFAIIGNLHVDLSMTPRIRMENVVLANTPWGSRPNMATIRMLDFRIRLWPLLHGRTILPDITVIQPDILLEKNAQGQNNWTFGPPSTSKGKPPSIGQLNIQNGMLAFRDPAIKTDLRLQVSTRPPKPGEAYASLVVGGTGSFKNAPFSLQGQGASLLSLRNVNQPYPLQVKVRIGGSQASVGGTLTDPMQLRGVNLGLNIRGDDLSKLYPIIGTPLPTTAAYSLTGHLTRQGKTWILSDFHGRVGSSDLSGTMSATLQKRLYMQGNLRSRNLNFKDLAGFIGAKPKSVGTKLKVEAKTAGKGHVLPNKSYNLKALRAADADVVYRADHIEAPSLPLDDLSVHLTLKQGVLTLHPLNFGVADGNVVSQVMLDARKPVMDTRLDATVRGLRLKKLFPKLHFKQASTGRFGGKATLSTHGNSFALMAGNATGRLGLAMGGGSVADLLVALAQIHLGNALVDWLSGVKKERINCAVADFQLNNGLMQTKTFVIDTPSANILGSGTVNLKNEQLKLVLTTKPKHITIVSARGPLHITGSFKHPHFGVDETAIAVRAGAAVALGALLSPVAAILPLIDTAPGKPLDCPVLMNKAGKRVKAEAVKSAKTRAR